MFTSSQNVLAFPTRLEGGKNIVGRMIGPKPATEVRSSQRPDSGLGVISGLNLPDAVEGPSRVGAVHAGEKTPGGRVPPRAIASFQLNPAGVRAFWHYLGVTAAVFFAIFTPASAAEPGVAPQNAPEDPFAIPTWSLSTSLSAAAGYRDNVLLSSSNPDGSGFLRGEAEVMLLSLPVRGWDGFMFFNVTETHFFSAQDTDHERSAIITSEAHWQAAAAVKVGGQVQLYHFDQVFDVSTTEATLDTAQLKVTGATLAPSVRWNFARNWWVEARAAGRKDSYASDVDDYREGEGSARLGRDGASGSVLSFAATRQWRSYDSREQYTAAGRPLAGTHLKFLKTGLSARYTLVPDAAKHWRFALTALVEENRDNGSGYFNFDRQQLTADLTWKGKDWEVRCSAGVAHYDFPVQQVGIGIAPENRQKKEYRLTVETTRRLTAAWSAVALFETERAFSNDDRSQFRVKTGYVGLQWSWDNLSLD